MDKTTSQTDWCKITGDKLETDWAVRVIWMEVSSYQVNGSEKMLSVT